MTLASGRHHRLTMNRGERGLRRNKRYALYAILYTLCAMRYTLYSIRYTIYDIRYT